jgi:LL-diaminopimelate aminotransferase
VAALAERKRQLIAEGRDVIDLGAGDADVAPPEVALEALATAAREPAMSRYAFQVGLVAFRESIARYMDRRFGVRADPMTEVLPLIGSKEGLAHLPFAVTNPGDACVVPEPGYPSYGGGTILSGAELIRYPLRRDNGFLVDLDTIPESRLRTVRLVYLNYPNNPTGAAAPLDYLRRTIEICRERGILIAYDNPYAELTYDGYQAPSILALDGAREVAVEFHSVSKSFGMTGWRLGWVVGNTEVVQALSKVKTYVDTGAFLAVQRAGAAVLDKAEEIISPLRATFCERRDALGAALREDGWDCDPPLGGMYLWLPLPSGVASAAFAREALEREALVTLAGSVLGEAGEGFVRLSFITGPDRLRDAAARLTRVRERMHVPSSGT